MARESWEQRVDRVAETRYQAEQENRHYHIRDYLGGDRGQFSSFSWYDDRTGRSVSADTVRRTRSTLERAERQFNRLMSGGRVGSGSASPTVHP